MKKVGILGSLFVLLFTLSCTSVQKKDTYRGLKFDFGTAVPLLIQNPYGTPVRIELKCAAPGEDGFSFKKKAVVPARGDLVMPIPRNAEWCEAWPKVLFPWEAAR